MMNELVHTIMTRNPVSINAKDSLADAVRIIASKKLHHLPVIDNDQLVGLISSYEISEHLGRVTDPENVKIEDVMQKRIVNIESTDKVGTAAELLLDRRFHALPVVDDGKLVGIITSYDVLRDEFKREYRNPVLYTEVFELNHRAAM